MVIMSKNKYINKIQQMYISVYSPPLLRRRNGPTDESSHLGHGRLNQSGQDNRRTNIPQDTAPQTTDYDVLQSNDRYKMSYFVGCTFHFFNVLLTSTYLAVPSEEVEYFKLMFIRLRTTRTGCLLFYPNKFRK